MKNLPHKSTLACFFLVSCFLWQGRCQAQFADSIWTGNATFVIPSLVTFSNNLQQSTPRTTSNVSLVVPLEVWFWDDNTFLVLLNQRAMGASEDRAPLQPLIGEWTIPAVRRVGALLGVEKVPYGANLFEELTGQFSYNSKRRAGTFQAIQKDTFKQAGQGDENYIAPGAQQVIAGKFSLARTGSMTVSGTLTINPNPIGPNGLKYVGRAPTFQMVLSPTARKPSVEGVGGMDD